jgi:hypothetical protein
MFGTPPVLFGYMVVQSLNHHPAEDEQCLEHAKTPLHWVRGISEIQANLVQQHVEPVVMLAAERDGKPRDVITPTNMVRFDPFGATANDAFASFPARSVHDGLPIER